GLTIAAGCTSNKSQNEGTNAELAAQIISDTTMARVDSMAREILKGSLNAGSGYSQVWARDLNTFVETACEVNDPAEIREALMIFLKLQQPNGELVDGYVLNEDFTWGDPEVYRTPYDKEHVGFKNTVETDQETSWIQALCKYADKTGDTAVFTDTVAGKSVNTHIDDMINYLLTERFNKEYGLLYGAFTADWGDVQPDSTNVVDFTENSTRTIDAYDNAMLVIALDRLAKSNPSMPGIEKNTELRDSIASRTRRYLWDEKQQKIVPHIHIDPSPLPADFDETKMHYHGGTAIAIEAGLLNPEEIAAVNSQMLENVKQSGMPSIGLTIYPTYPAGFFSGGMAEPYVYQNGGDWTWFGGRMIQQLIANGYVKEAYEEIQPMLERVVKNNGFYEWYGQGGVPSGSGKFKGSAGVLAVAIQMLRDWAEENKAE
ncbi:MAG: hypothetical protein J6C91_02690, partial [Muribaculaceae bacterium]|nr:hypothetical protein [Muribaculaceae bacterium]